MIATNVIGVFYVAPTNLGTIFVVVALVAVIVLVEFARFLLYEARVRFGTRVRVRVRVRDSAIFEKGGCGCGRTRRLKNY